MMNKKVTKSSLMLSVMALLLCVSMLVGSTYAWFTDTVTSSNNAIIAGNLDVDVYYGDPADENSIKDTTALFSNVVRWEPGAVAYENLTVVNKGTLALKYQMIVNFTDENHMIDGDYCLSQILKIGVVKGGLTDGLSREAVLAEVTEWNSLADFDDVLAGELLAGAVADAYALVIWWEPTADDGNWNVNNGKETDDGEDFLHIGFGVSVIATQMMAEEDAFDKTYDEGARFPVNYSTTLGGKFGKIDVEVEVPAGSFEPTSGEYTLEMSGYSFENDNTAATLNFDMKLMDGSSKADTGISEYPVEIQLPHPFINADNLEVYHNNELVENATYDAAKRTVSFVTDGFSPFEIKYVDYVDPTFELEYKTENGKYVITKGMFFVDPVAYFSAEGNLTVGDKDVVVDPACITVDFTKDGQQYFVVSNRATSIFVAPDGTSEYVAKNGTFDVSNVDFRSNQSGKLYSMFSSIQTNEHNTIYLLPGVYNEATTVNVYSSVDIIGLGNTDAVKIIKLSSSNSNRHLLNCSGTKADYIQVTIRNLYLDATTNTTGGKDNAAVQSIRKSKVKCYDLTIIKNPTNFASVAFYVNANNAVDNVKYNAYMYAENCVFNSTNVNGVMDNRGAGKAYFYYNNLTYGNNQTYTASGTYTKNIILDCSDWTWGIE